MSHVRHWSAVSLALVIGAAVVAVPAHSQEVIRTETRLVLVDAVVTGKKGDYLRDLTQKDFKVYEDNKEVTIKSFSFEADPASPSNSQPRYLVLFFDNANMDLAAQRYARDAAAKFVAANAGQKRMIAIVEYGSSLRIAQNFTDDGERLKQVVQGVKVAPRMTESNGLPAAGLNRAAASYGTRNSILALKSLVKNLAGVPGRKSLVLFSSGFRLDAELLTELNQLIDASNQANVAFYPIDVRGLVTPLPPVGVLTQPGGGNRPLLAFAHMPALPPALPYLMFQKPGGGSPGGSPGGGTPGGGTRPGGGVNPGGGTPGGGVRPGGGGSSPGGGTRPGGGTHPPTNNGGGGVTNNPNNNRTVQPNLNRGLIMPPTFPNASDNQQPLYMLANGTGGFVIVNTNDLLGGLDKIGKEQNEHYMIGYSPENFEEGKCHTLKVKVNTQGASVRFRTGYCDAKPNDVLSGNPVEKDLEKVILASSPGTVKAELLAPYFYTAANSTRMNVTIEVPSEMVAFEKKKGKYHGTVNILGMVYREGGSAVAARFSDTMKFDFDDKKAMEAWQQRPVLHYEKDVEGVPGKYTLKVAVSSGSKNVAKVELPLVIDPYDGKSLSVSDVAYSTAMRRVSKAEAGTDTLMSEDRTPLIASGMQLYPSARSAFKKTETVAIYAEVYAPALGDPEPPKDFAASIQMRVREAKSGKVVVDSGAMRVGDLVPGNPVVPIALRLPVDTLTPGEYICELVSADVLGGQGRRASKFTVE